MDVSITTVRFWCDYTVNQKYWLEQGKTKRKRHHSVRFGGARCPAGLWIYSCCMNVYRIPPEVVSLPIRAIYLSELCSRSVPQQQQIPVR